MNKNRKIWKTTNFIVLFRLVQVHTRVLHFLSSTSNFFHPQQCVRTYIRIPGVRNMPWRALDAPRVAIRFSLARRQPWVTPTNDDCVYQTFNYPPTHQHPVTSHPFFFSPFLVSRVPMFCQWLFDNYRRMIYSTCAIKKI